MIVDSRIVANAAESMLAHRAIGHGGGSAQWRAARELAGWRHA